MTDLPTDLTERLRELFVDAGKPRASLFELYRFMLSATPAIISSLEELSRLKAGEGTDSSARQLRALADRLYSKSHLAPSERTLMLSAANVLEVFALPPAPGGRSDG